MSTRGVRRGADAVPTVPRPQRCGGDTEHPRHGGDGQVGFACALGTAGHGLGFHRTIVVATDVPSNRTRPKRHLNRV